MTSFKWTFSLASLVMILAIGLVFAPVGIAHEANEKIAGANNKLNPAHPALTLSVPSALPRGETANNTTNSVIDVDSMAEIQMLAPTFSGTDGDNPLKIQVASDMNLGRMSSAGFELTGTDFVINRFDMNGFALPTVTITDTNVTVADADATNPDGKNFVVSIGSNVLGADQDAIDDIYTLYVNTKDAAVTNNLDARLFIDANKRAHLGKHASAPSKTIKIMLVRDNIDGGTDGEGSGGQVYSTPGVHSVMRVPDVTTPVSGAFTVEVVLSEMPAGDVGPGFFTAMNGTIDNVDAGLPYDIAAVVREATDLNGDTDTDDPGEAAIAVAAVAANNPLTTGYDDKFYPYYLTVTPKLDLAKDQQHEVTIKVNNFMDTAQPMANEYVAGLDPDYEIAIAARALVGPDPGFTHPEGVANQKALPAVTVPAGGYLVLLNHDAEVGHDKHAGIQAPATGDDYVVHQKYSWQGANIHAADLESFFRNGGTIQVIAGKDLVGTLLITEIMWGSLNGNVKNQWIELHNPGTADLMIAPNQWFLGLYGPAGRSAADLAADINFKVVDTMSNSPGGVYWSVVGKGQSGRTQNTPGEVNEDAISMYRVIIDGVAQDGTMASSWLQSSLPSANLRGLRVGTPGAASPPGMAPVVVVPPPPPPPPAPTPTPVAMKDDIDITEIMADSGNGRFPQWIELTNQAAGEVSLDGWSLNISNDPADADVLGSSLVIDLSGNTLGVSEHPGNMGKGQSLLVIAFSGRGSDNLGNVAIVDASDEDQLDQTGRYLLLSETAFKLVLMPPQTSGITVYGDMAGNLKDGAAAWALPMAEGMRSSLIRMEMDTAMMATMGTSADGWRVASMTDLASGQITWYGSDEDAGTPGYDNGGPLPVELSMFYPKRDQLTGQVVITWETQSELNNAGFFIKRSEAKDGKFVVINPTMIAGAGTTSEKQSYTYTDTSAKPNVVYYYQIEDVSLDGQRQTLTLGTRLRGHIGAAGKATTTWGELKNVQE